MYRSSQKIAGSRSKTDGPEASVIRKSSRKKSDQAETNDEQEESQVDMNDINSSAVSIVT